MNTFETMCVLR